MTGGPQQQLFANKPALVTVQLRVCQPAGPCSWTNASGTVDLVRAY